jgi:Co/Zn/Cd efflux system component
MSEVVDLAAQRMKDPQTTSDGTSYMIVMIVTGVAVLVVSTIGVILLHRHERTEDHNNEETSPSTIADD